MEYLRKKDDELNVVKIVLITAGIVLTVAAAVVVLYKVVKKHFKITFECEDCDFSEEDCYGDDDGFMPEYVFEGVTDENESTESKESDDIFDEIEKEDE